MTGARSKIVTAFTIGASLCAGIVAGKYHYGKSPQQIRLESGIVDQISPRQDHTVKVRFLSNKYMWGQSLLVGGRHLLSWDSDLSISELSPKGGDSLVCVVISRSGAPRTTFSIPMTELLKLDEIRIGMEDFNSPEARFAPAVDVTYLNDSPPEGAQ